MEKFIERVGVWWVLALVTVVVVAYAFWGAAVLRSQHMGGTFSKSVASALTIL